MRHEEISPGIHQVGVNDWNLRDFHGYRTGRGSSYNAYLIRDRKTCLIDTVKQSFSAELVANISRLADPASVDYIVSNHLELDHAGSLKALLALCPRAKILATRAWAAGAEKYFGPGLPLKIVGAGDTLALGENTLAFLPAPMLHWPDSMLTWLPEKKILFSNDAFGQHYAADFHYDDEAPGDILMEEAARYYANILMPLGNLVGKLLDQATAMRLEPSLIAPSHGLLWRGAPGKVISAYRRWAAGQTSRKVLVVYHTMWGSTELLARAIAAGAGERGVPLAVRSLGAADRSEAALEALEAGTIALGSAVLNNLVLPAMADLWHYLKGLKPPARRWAVFGSYGWNQRVLPAFAAEIAAAGFPADKGVCQARFRPDADELAAARDWGAALAGELTADQAGDEGNEQGAG